MTVCFTGHRTSKLCGWDPNKYRTAHNQLVELIKKLYSKGYTNFITGGAQGFDQLVFWAVNKVQTEHPELSIKNRLYIPFKNYECRWAPYSCFGQGEFQAMLKLADEVRYTLPYMPHSKSEINKALFQRNSDMLKNSDLLVSFTDPTETNKSGGTYGCIKTAKYMGKEILPVNYSIMPAGVQLQMDGIIEKKTYFVTVRADVERNIMVETSETDSETIKKIALSDFHKIVHDLTIIEAHTTTASDLNGTPI